ncbi:MAG: PQQ-binding-like beta-propeller repeat protein, partial [Bacteroidetes bacterium]|nr:PQQ-binding-like beta-propeller repeat protein [Bacteroidota bacterium]
MDECNVYASTSDRAMFCLDKVDGSEKWVFEPDDNRKGCGTGLSKLVGFDEKSIYCADIAGSLFSLDKENGKMNWRFATASGTAGNCYEDHDRWKSKITSNFHLSDAGIMFMTHKEMVLLDKEKGYCVFSAML